MLLLDLHARIREELEPDYLLIDARAGAIELGGLATTILADTVVCMFGANQESLDGTLMAAEALKAAPRLKGQQPIRVVPVLTRTTSEPPAEGPFAEGNGPGEFSPGLLSAAMPWERRPSHQSALEGRERAGGRILAALQAAGMCNLFTQGIAALRCPGLILPARWAGWMAGFQIRTRIHMLAST
jgi:hypothetical protein